MSNLIVHHGDVEHTIEYGENCPICQEAVKDFLPVQDIFEAGRKAERERIFKIFNKVYQDSFPRYNTIKKVYEAKDIDGMFEHIEVMDTDFAWELGKLQDEVKGKAIGEKE